MFTIGTVASQLGISPDVLRKWEARHGWPVPERTDGGRRLYDEQQLRMLHVARRHIESGHPVATALALARSQADAAPLPVQDSSMVAPLMRLVGDGDLATLHRTLLALCERKGAIDFIENCAAPLMRAVGQAWSAGQLRVWQEHAVSVLMREVLATLRPSPGAERQTGQPLALLATPPGEHHTLGLTMAGLILRHEGVFCIELGAETPLGEVAAAARDCAADIVGLSISRALPVRTTHAFAQALRAALPPTCALWLGGAGASCRRADNIRICCDTAAIRRELARIKPVRDAVSRSSE